MGLQPIEKGCCSTLHREMHFLGEHLDAQKQCVRLVADAELALVAGEFVEYDTAGAVPGGNFTSITWVEDCLGRVAA